MVNILFVCLGNICRSPLAEGIFQNLVDNKKLSGQIFCDSAGTSGWHIGEPPDRRSEAIANQHGLTLNHSGRQLDKEDFQNYDYIIAMDKHNLEDIKNSSGFESFDSSRLFLMRKFDAEGKGKDVPDPYFGGPEGFENVYQMLDRSCKKFLEYLQENHQLRPKLL